MKAAGSLLDLTLHRNMLIYFFKLPWFRFKRKVMCMHAHLYTGICMSVQMPIEGAGQRHQICWSNRQFVSSLMWVLRT